jgi:hypothetical protein
MKKVLLIAITLSLNCFAEKFHCQLILQSENTYPDNIIIPDVSSKTECLIKAKELFHKNSDTYNKLFIMIDEKFVKVKTDEN